MKKALKSLLKPQWYMIDVKFLNVHISLLKMHLSDILNSEKEMKKKLMSVNAVYQQFNKVMLWWKIIQNPASWIQKEWQQKDAKLFSIKAVWKGIYCEIWKLQESVILQKISLNINVKKDNCQFKIKKFNSKTVTVTSASEPVRAFVFIYVME